MMAVRRSCGVWCPVPVLKSIKKDALAPESERSVSKATRPISHRHAPHPAAFGRADVLCAVAVVPHAAVDGDRAGVGTEVQVSPLERRALAFEWASVSYEHKLRQSITRTAPVRRPMTS